MKRVIVRLANHLSPAGRSGTLGAVTCAAGAKAKAADCDKQKAVCDGGCSTCTRLYGPQVVYCVQDCEKCRGNFAASACGKPPAEDACAKELETCLERCGP